MRITGGVLCGRHIKCPSGIIRPAMDRMRESLFSVLGDLSGRSFLDLFSGSGLIAMEAASRGASEVVLVEKDPLKTKTVLENVSIAPVKVQCKFLSVELFVARNKKAFDVVFLDPPFPYKFHEDLVKRCSKSGTVVEGGTLLIHRPSEVKMSEKIDRLVRYDQRIYGRSVVDLYRFE